MTRHTYDTDIDIAGLSVPLGLTYDFIPGYDVDEVDPPFEPYVEIIAATFAWEGLEREAPEWLLGVLRTSLDLHDELVAHAIDECQPDPDAARDAAAEALV